MERVSNFHSYNFYERKKRMAIVKCFKDYTDEELLSLTDGQIEELIRLECAFKGIALTMEEPIWEEKGTEIPRVRAYTIGEFTVLSSERAEEIFDVLTKGELFSKTCANNDYDCKYLEIIDSRHYRNPSISISDVILPEVWRNLKEEQKVLSRKKTLFKESQKEWEKWIDDRDEISSEIYQKIRELQNNEAERINCTNLFAKYMEMAKGDFEIALLFYEKFPKSIKEEDFIEHLKKTFQQEKGIENNE